MRRITLKVILIGESGVGKTSLINQYVTGQCSSNYKGIVFNSLAFDTHF